MNILHYSKCFKQLSFILLTTILVACGGGGSEDGGSIGTNDITLQDNMSVATNDEPVVIIEEPVITREFSGSVGDGPIVGATLNFYDKNGKFVKSVVSDDLARYRIRVKAKGKLYPLTVEVVGGIDLVTNRAPDFKMVSVVTDPGVKQANINPFTTLIVESAKLMSGGLNDENISSAKTNIVNNMNFGLDPALVPDPIRTRIDDSNIGVIVKSSEALGEMIRRASSSLMATGDVVNADELVNIIADDMIDGVLDGQGGDLASSRVAAVSTLVSGKVLIESLSNNLKVDGANATAVMDDAILAVAPSAPDSSLTANVSINQELLDQTIVSIEASKALVSSSELEAIANTLQTLEAGMLASDVESELPDGTSESLNQAIETATYADDTELNQVNDVVSGGNTEPTNNPPVISGIPALMVNEDSVYAFQPDVSDLDGDALSFSIVNRPAWASFDSSNGLLHGIPANSDVGVYTDVTISVSDGADSATLAPFSITVNNTNDAPTISGTPSSSVDSGALYDFQPSAYDIDGDSLQFSASNLPSWAGLDIETGRLWGIPGEPEVGVYDNIVISVSDGEATSSLPAFSITVNTTVVPNTAPTISGVPSASVVVDDVYSFVPSASDADNDFLVFSISNKPVWATFNIADGHLSGTPNSSHAGLYSDILITVSDGVASRSLPAFAIEVSQKSNTPPAIGGIPLAMINANSFYSFQPVVSDPDNDTLTFSVANKPLWASFSITTGELFGTPSNSDEGTFTDIVISVSDGKDSASLSAFSITVAVTQSAPVISGSPSTAVYEDTSYSFTPTANDADGDMLTYSIVNKPAWASFDTTTGELAGVPGSVNVGTTNNIVISVTDGFSDPVSLASFSITVESSSAILSWTPPTTRSDLTPLPYSEIGGYKVYTGTDPNNLTLLVNISDSSLTEHIITNLAPATHYFAVTAYNVDGVESELSGTVNKTINSL